MLVLPNDDKKMKIAEDKDKEDDNIEDDDIKE